MNKLRGTIACLVALIYLAFLVGQDVQAQTASVTISTDQPLYPIWGLGGPVRVTAQNLISGVAYYLWSQKPGQRVSNFTGLTFSQGNGTLPAPIILNITSHDPSGTYLLSLSTSGTTDTRGAVTHFGVLGTDSRSYERTDMVTVAGGGFAPNTTIALTISSVNGTFPGFPINLTSPDSGAFQYHFKLAPSARMGTITATITGTSYDKHQPETAKSIFTVTSTTFTAQTFMAPASRIERTLQATTTYRLTYKDGSPVTSANVTAYIILASKRVYNVPLILVNPTSGEWNASWTLPPSTNETTYNFQFSPANFTDSYGNKGQGSPLTSSDFKVVTATLKPALHAAQTLERTQNAVLTLSATYPSGADVMNLNQTTVALLTSTRTVIKLTPSFNMSQAVASYKIPVNAVLGGWTANYTVQDPWGNSGSGTFIFHVELANLTFEAQVPNATERTTFLNINNTVYYPDGTTLNSAVTLQMQGENKSWTPALNFDPANGKWSWSLYVTQNATLGKFNVTWAARDPYGNAQRSNYTTFIIPAQFSFDVVRNNTAAPALSNLDLPVLVRYPNGSVLTNGFGNVTGSYQNTTGYVFTYPLAYNATNTTWHMFFFVPAQSNATLSFNAADRFGNFAIATDAYNLKITPPPRAIALNLIIAGVVGALIPIGLLIWAFATISTRRRKHRP